MSDFYYSLLDQVEPSIRVHDSGESARAAIYVRTSSASQKFGYSIGEQIRQCVSRCHLLGWTVHFVFRDEAESGNDTDRPMFQEMLSCAERRGFDVLVFWKLDRFSRSIMHAVQLEKQFHDWGVALHSVTEQLDTTTPAGRFNFRNIANAAEFERDLIQQRTTMGHIARAMEHKWPNATPPLGYEVREDGKLDVVPTEATLVRRIFRDYLNEKSMPAVAEKLNQEDRFGRRGKQWTANTIRNVLQNRLYIGEYSVRNVSAQVEEYQILSEKMFEKATAVRTRFSTSGTSKRPPMPKQRKLQSIESVASMYAEFLDQ